MFNRKNNTPVKKAPAITMNAASRSGFLIAGSTKLP